MANFNPADSGYVEVKDRIEAFYAKYPEGSIQTEIVMLTDNKVVTKSFAYRFLEDTRPGVGHSQLAIPGKTNYTRDSELENCETSSIGRAIAALGFEVKKAFASANEVANKQSDAAPRSTNATVSQQVKQADSGNSQGSSNVAQSLGISANPATQAQKNLIRAKARDFGITDDELKSLRLSITGKHSSKEFTSGDVDAMLEGIKSAAEAKALTGGEVVA